MPELRRADTAYAQVATHIREQIHGGQLQPGDRVPSVREIAAQWKISKATADKALSTLRAEGLLVAVTGIGTQVAPRIPTVQTGAERFRRMLTSGRATRPGERSHILDSELAPATETAAEFLRIEPGTPAVRRRRMFTEDDGTVIALSTSWLRGELSERVPALLDVASIPGGTIGAVREATNRQPGLQQSQLSARLVTGEEAELLQLAEPAAVLIAESRLSDEDGDPLEYGVDVIVPGNSYAVGVDLSLM